MKILTGICLIFYFVNYFCLTIAIAAISLPKHLKYDVKLGPFTIGKAELDYLGIVKDERYGKVRHFRVLVKTTQYKGIEDIYANFDTLYPLKIIRNISYLGHREKIIELYDQTKGIVKILKDNSPTVTLHQSLPIDNVFLLIMRSQIKGITQMDGKMIHLPTASYKIEVKNGRRIRTKMGTFESFLVKTVPSKVTLWFARDSRLPIRVSGAIPILPYALSIINVEK